MTDKMTLYFHQDFNNIPMYSKKEVLEVLEKRDKKLRERALVLMHKKTGDIYEYFWGGCFGDVIAWEDTTENDEIIDEASPIMFNDDKRFNLNDYEILSPL